MVLQDKTSLTSLYANPIYSTTLRRTARLILAKGPMRGLSCFKILYFYSFWTRTTIHELQHRLLLGRENYLRGGLASQQIKERWGSIEAFLLRGFGSRYEKPKDFASISW